MKRYDCEVGLYSYGMNEVPEGTWVRHEDVKITAIMNFNLLDQIRRLEKEKKDLWEVAVKNGELACAVQHQLNDANDAIKELEQKVSRRDTIIKLYERDQ